MMNPSELAWRSAFSLRSASGGEKIYIYKPWKTIFRVLSCYYVFFAFLTLISFHVLILFLLPVWIILLYEFYIALKWMENFNISPIKMTVFSLFIETGFIIASPYIRKGIGWFISDFVPSLIFP